MARAKPRSATCIWAVLAQLAVVEERLVRGTVGTCSEVMLEVILEQHGNVIMCMPWSWPADQQFLLAYCILDLLESVVMRTKFDGCDPRSAGRGCWMLPFYHLYGKFLVEGSWDSVIIVCNSAHREWWSSCVVLAEAGHIEWSCIEMVFYTENDELIMWTYGHDMLWWVGAACIERVGSESASALCKRKHASSGWLG